MNLFVEFETFLFSKDDVVCGCDVWDGVFVCFVAIHGNLPAACSCSHATERHLETGVRKVGGEPWEVARS